MKKLILFALIGLFMITSTMAQSTNAGITGFVRDTKGEALPGATVLVRNDATGFSVGTVTGSNGSYNIQQLPLGDNYSITVSFVGYGTQRLGGFNLNLGDVLRVDFNLEYQAQALDEITVVANPITSQIDRMGAVTSVTARDMATLPVDGRNFASLIDLSPVSRGFNLLGQLFSSTNFVIDGMTHRSAVSSGTANRGPYSISMEAIREFEVITNDYSVVHGRSGGGIVSAVTKSGTNTFQGSVFSFNRANWLSSTYDIRGNERDEQFAIYQHGFSLGGPIIKDRAHFFVTYDRQFDARPLHIADIRTAEDERRYNISKENLDRFLQIARDTYGVAQSQQVGVFDRHRNTHSFFGRVDWQINPTNLLTVRNNFAWDMNSQGVTDNTTINLYEVFGDHLSMANSIKASLRTILGTNLTNELKVQHLYTLDDGRPNSQLPASNIPRAIVRDIVSVVDGQNVRTNIQIGGQRFLPEKFEANVYQVVNNLMYKTDAVKYTFGADIMLNHLSSMATSEMNGRFFYRGMENFANNTPYRFAREVAFVDPTVVQYILSAGVYAEAELNLDPGIDLTVGLRADYTSYSDLPNFNELVFNELGLNTNNGARGFQIQPRLHFKWDINDQQKNIIKIGAGVFGSVLNNYMMINNLQFDGSKIFAVDLRGADVPVPNFPGYRQDPSTVPGVELFNLPGISRLATINKNHDDLKIPIVYKGNISYNKFIRDRIRLGVNFIAAFARNNYMYIDRNMVDEPFFRLDNEANRGVFVPAASITAAGSANWLMGRKTNQVGRVLELVSEGKVNTYTFILDGTFRYFRDGQITASYTWNSTRDNTSYNGNVANTATLLQMVIDDPRDLSRMSYSNAHFRNKVVVYGTLPSFYGIVVGIRYSGMGGTRYSLIVNGNVNGDFVSTNDLAFVFDPNDPATDPAIAQAMRNVLNNPDNLAKTHIESSLGKIAERNGGINGFSGTWDLRISRRFNFANNTGFELSADLFNVANFLNKEKGVNYNMGNQMLTNIRGFDPGTNRYVYAVNPNVGVVFPQGTPYQFQIGGRFFF